MYVKHSGDGKYFLIGAKTEADVVICKMANESSLMLINLKHFIAKEKITCRPDYIDLKLINCTSVINETGIPLIRFHNLRHTWC